MDTMKDDSSHSKRRSFHEVVQPCFPGNRKNNAKILEYLPTSSNVPNFDNRAIPGAPSL